MTRARHRAGTAPLIALALALAAACSDAKPVRRTAIAYQLVELAPSAPPDAIATFRAEGAVPLSLPLVSAEPAKVSVPPCFDARGESIACTWTVGLRHADGTEHDVGLELFVAAVPRVVIDAAPGAALLALIDVLERTLPGAWSSALATTEDPTLGDELAATLDQLRTMRRGVEELRSGRRRAIDLGALTAQNGVSLRLVVDRASLPELDRWAVAIVGGLRAKTLHPWEVDDAGTLTFAAGLSPRGDGEDPFSAFTDELPTTLAEGTLEQSERFFGMIGTGLAVAGAVAAVAGASGAATALAGVGAIVFCVSTFAPAATATVLASAGKLANGDPIGADQLIPGLKHIAKQYVALGLSTVVARVAGAGDEIGEAVVGVLDAFSGLSDTTAGKLVSAVTRCASAPSGCLSDPLGPGNGTTPPAPSGSTDPDDGDPADMPAQCNDVQTNGGDTPETRTIDLGRRSGTFTFSFDTYSIRDQMTVTYEGSVLFDTGCVGASGTQTLTYSGRSTQVVVSVTPNCAGDTSTGWQFSVSCPQ